MKDVSFKFLLLLQVFLLLGHGYLYSGEQGGKKVKVLLAGDSTMQDVNHEKNTGDKYYPASLMRKWKFSILLKVDVVPGHS